MAFAMSAGTNRLLDYRTVRAAVSLAELAFDERRVAQADEDWWCDVLEEVSGYAPHELRELAPELAGREDFAERLEAAGEDIPGIGRLCGWLRAVRGLELSLGGVFRLAFSRVLAPAAGERSGAGSADARRRVDEIAQLVSAAERFEAADERVAGDWGFGGDRVGGLAGDRDGGLAGDRDPGMAALVGRFRDFLLAGRFAERPMAGAPGDERAVQLCTASQFARERPLVDVAIWLDGSSPKWWKLDQRELVNVRVLAGDRAIGPYGPGEAKRDADEKLARTLLACTAAVREEIRVFASLHDVEGAEQPGGLIDILRPLARPDELAADTEVDR